LQQGKRNERYQQDVKRWQKRYHEVEQATATAIKDGRVPSTQDVKPLIRHYLAISKGLPENSYDLLPIKYCAIKVVDGSDGEEPKWSALYDFKYQDPQSDTKVRAVSGHGHTIDSGDASKTYGYWQKLINPYVNSR
jgi:hypothetical protein